MCCGETSYERIVTIMMMLTIGVTVIEQALNKHIFLHFYFESFLLSEYVIIYGRVYNRGNEFSTFFINASLKGDTKYKTWAKEPQRISE